MSKGQLKVPFYSDFSLACAKDCGTGKRDVFLPAFLFRFLSLCLFPVFASSGASLEAPVKEDALKVHRKHYRKTVKMKTKMKISCPKWLIIGSLRASSSGRSDGGAGKGRRDCNYVSGIRIPPPIPCGYPSTELSDFSANVNKH